MRVVMKLFEGQLFNVSNVRVRGTLSADNLDYPVLSRADTTDTGRIRSIFRLMLPILKNIQYFVKWTLLRYCDHTQRFQEWILPILQNTQYFRVPQNTGGGGMFCFLLHIGSNFGNTLLVT